MDINEEFEKWDEETMHTPIGKIFWGKGSNLVARGHQIIRTARKRACKQSRIDTLEEIKKN